MKKSFLSMSQTILFSVLLINNRTRRLHLMTREEFQQEAVRLRPMLLQAAQGYLHNTADSEDAVQTVLERLWQMVDNVKSPMDGLALVLLRHHCVDIIRQQVPTTKLDGHDRAEEEENNDNISRVIRLINNLPPLQQTIIKLRHIDNKSFAKISAMTGMKEATVRKNLSRARLALRDMILKEKNNE